MLNEVVASSVPNVPVHIGGSSSLYKGGLCANHFHDEIEFLRIRKGKMACVLADKTIELCAGDVVFINSRIPHQTRVLEDDTADILLQINTDAFATQQISKYLSRFINNSENQIVVFSHKDKESKSLCFYIDEILKEFENKNTSYELYIKANIYNILAFLYRNKILIDAESFFDIKTVDKVLPILEYIDQNYQNLITLEEVSEILHLNPYYFCRIFKKATNSTFTEYLNFVRISKAEKLLASTSKSVMEVSLDVGFSSVSYFNRTFKKYKNCTPTVYKKIKYAQN